MLSFHLSPLFPSALLSPFSSLSPPSLLSSPPLSSPLSTLYPLPWPGYKKNFNSLLTPEVFI